MQKYYTEYFSIYCTFITKDLIATFESLQGRNIKVINEFYKAFYGINEKTISAKDKEKILNSLKTTVNGYCQNGDIATYKKVEAKIDCKNKYFVKSLSKMINVQKAFNQFNEATADFTKVSPSSLLKQGMIEFNNAMAHLFEGLSTSETSFDTNIKKASVHLYRGALDNYKTLIMSKKSLTPAQKDILINIRVDEIDSMGLEVKSSNKITTFDDYQRFARSLHNIK